MSIIEKLDLTPFEVEQIVLEWYKSDRCIEHFKSVDGVDLNDYLIKKIKSSYNIKEYGKIDLTSSLNKHFLNRLLIYFHNNGNPKIVYNDFKSFPIKYLVEIDYDILFNINRVGYKYIYDLKDAIEKAIKIT